MARKKYRKRYRRNNAKGLAIKALKKVNKLENAVEKKYLSKAVHTLLPIPDGNGVTHCLNNMSQGHYSDSRIGD